MSRQKVLTETDQAALHKLLTERDRLIGVLNGLSLKRLAEHFRCSRMTILRYARNKAGCVRNVHPKVTCSTAEDHAGD